MPDPPLDESPAWGWTAAQRRALIAILAVLCVVLAARYALNPVFVSDPQPDVPPRYEDLADRIDPNTADWQTLAALPTLGEKRAKAIVAYREARKPRSPGDAAFKAPEDLMSVRGIGVATVNNIRPYLIFSPVPPSRSRPR